MNLVYRDKAGETRSFILEGQKKVTLGREDGRELVIAEALVSRLHATIENVQGAFFLRDAGSANGTYLNGLRLSGTSAIMLRDGDVIEIGSTSLVFSSGILGSRAPRLTPTADGGQESAFALDDLILDGLAPFKARGEAQQAAWDEALARMASEPGPAALERALGLIALQTPADGAALFLAQKSGELAPAASFPGEPPAKHLGPIARSAFLEGEGRIFCPRVAADAPLDGNATLTRPRAHTTAAVPFHVRGERGHGVLAVERFAPRLDRTDLALLAVMADRIARALAPAPAPEIP